MLLAARFRSVVIEARLCRRFPQKCPSSSQFRLGYNETTNEFGTCSATPSPTPWCARNEPVAGG